MTDVEKSELVNAVLPFSTGGAGFIINGGEPTKVLPGGVARCKCELDPRYLPFYPERLFVGEAWNAWKIEDVIVDDVSQLKSAEPIASSDVPSDGKRLTLPVCRSSIALVVRYVGPNPEGAHFFGSLVGKRHRMPTDQSIAGGG